MVKTKETKTTKEVKAKTIKNHRENQQKQTSRPMSTLADMGLTFLLLLFGFLYGFDSFCIDLFGCFGFFGFQDGFDIFKCTLGSSKRLGRGCAPLLNKAFTLHGFPYIRGFLV